VEDGRTADDSLAAHKRRLAEIEAEYQRAEARTADDGVAAARRYLAELDEEHKRWRDAWEAADRAAHPKEWKRDPRTGEWVNHWSIWREDKTGILLFAAGMAVFLAPVIGAWLWYFTDQAWPVRDADPQRRSLG
jgi:hypothetical protein